MQLNFFRRHEPEPVAPAAPVEIPAQPPEIQPEAATGTDGFLTYSLLLDAQKHIKGYRMAWHDAAEHDDSDAAEPLRSLLLCLADNLNNAKAGWRLGKLVIYLDVTAAGLRLAELQALPPRSVVLCLKLADLTDEGSQPALEALRAQGFGVMLCGEDNWPEAPAVPKAPAAPAPAATAGAPEEPPPYDPFAALAHLTHLEVPKGRKELIEAARKSRPPGSAAVVPIAIGTQSWAEFDACAARRIDVFVPSGDAMAAPSEPGASHLQAESVLIIRVMQMIQRNEDVRMIEAALEHDTSLTARLLQHINSPAMGLSVEVQSLHHAVGLLGYSPLFRWLSLLLATSNKPSLAYMTKKALMRGRFVELLGHETLAADESTNLFLAGMFSLIDRVLGIPIEEMLAQVQLAETVQLAIRERGGIYGPFVSLVESCETDAAGAAALSASLGLSAEKVNAAHLSAMVWALDVNRSEAAY